MFEQLRQSASEARRMLGKLLGELALSPERYVAERARLDALAEQAAHEEASTKGADNGEPVRRLTQEEVTTWLERAAEPVASFDRPRTNAVMVARNLLEALGAPGEPSDAEVVLERLESCVAQSRRWVNLPRSIQVRLVELLAAWARAIGEENDSMRPHVGRLLSLLTQHQRAERPGQAHGLSRVHLPQLASWSDDAERAHADLRVYAYEPHLLTRSGFAKPKSARRSPSSSREVRAVTVEPRVLERTRGQRLALVAHSRRVEAGERIERAFEFATVEWVEIEHPRAAERLAERLRARTIDLVVLTRYVNHHDGDRLVEAARVGEVAIVRVDSYGVRAVEAALKEKLED